MNTKTRFALAGWVALMLGVAGAADEPTQTIKAGPLSFETPKTWKSERPTSSMRKAQMKVEPIAGDSEPAEMSVIALNGGGGGVDANVTRWEGQFSGDDGKHPKAKVEMKKGKNVEVTRVEISGNYAGMSMPGQAKKEASANTKLLGAIVMTPETGYFLKLTGPDKTVSSIAKQFDAMIASMTLEQ